jgi:hypothetical protein
VITYALIAGKYPFYDDHKKKLLTRILSCDYEFVPETLWDNISEECKDLIIQLL